MKTPPSLAKCSLELRPYQQSIIDVSIEHFRRSDAPIIIDACVGAGKTLIISHIARHVVNKGGRVISLAHTKELVESAYYTFLDYAQDMECGVFSAGMGRKDTEHSIIFCSEKTLINGLDKFLPIDLLIIDEAHRVNDSNVETCYMRIISHFQAANPKLRILGLTGTSFRTTTGPIAGPDKLFKKIIATVSVPELVEQGYLTRPVAPLNQEAYDFSGVKLVAGKFNEADLQAAVSNTRLTRTIIDSVVLQTESRNKVLIFASTLKHAQEIVGYLPKGKAGYLDGTLSKTDREAVLGAFSTGAVKYMINRDILTTGYNEVAIDAVCILRPTESRGLLIQMIGRGLRLHPGKADMLILDFAGNLDRHGNGSLDEVFLKEAKAKKLSLGSDGEKQCPSCAEWVNEMARRCQCGHYFVFVECPDCGAHNDITRRYCWSCDYELIDPNAKLTSRANQIDVTSATVSGIDMSVYHKNTDTLRVVFHTAQGNYNQFFVPGSRYLKYFLGKTTGSYGYRLDELMELPLQEIVDLKPDLHIPREILLKPDGKYQKVVEWVF
jgi:DNA repair protein RadD